MEKARSRKRGGARRKECPMREITVNASLEEISRVTDFINTQLAELGCSERIRIQVDVAVDELFGNIVRYAYKPEVGEATVRVDVEDDPLSVIITFIDHGVPFDPLTKEFRDTTGLPARERPIGGLGPDYGQKNDGRYFLQLQGRAEYSDHP